MTLSELTIGDVAVFVRHDGSESEPFVVISHEKGFGTRYQNVTPMTPARIPTPSLYTVRRLGRGRLVPARIVMEGEPDFAAWLTTMTNYASAFASNDPGSAGPEFYDFSDKVRDTLAATARPEER